MDNDRKRVEIIQKAIERKCASLEPDPYLAQRVLKAANEKDKDKVTGISHGLVIALVMVLMTATAVVVSLTHRKEVERPFIATTIPDSENSQLDFDTGTEAAAVSTLASCGHANTTTEWVRRYVPIGVSGHELVDTYYSMCHTCGTVFWMRDEVLLYEEHDASMAVYEPGPWESGRDPYTCKYCHARWHVQEP